MSPNLPPQGVVRSAADPWNEAIRRFWRCLGGRLPTPAEQVEYERLLAGWVEARGDVVKAA